MIYQTGDGASVVLECCPNLYSLGYLVFAAAGLKQVYGYEEEHDTKFTEVSRNIKRISNVDQFAMKLSKILIPNLYQFSDILSGTQ